MQRSVRLLATFSPFLFIVILLLVPILVSQRAQAGAPPLEGCENREHQPIPTVYEPDLRTFAKVEIIKEGDKQRYEIQVNPTYYYLSRESQQWLYLRQCANIHLDHQAMRFQSARPNLREERAADCWAIKHMSENKQFHFSERTVRTIERDLERMNAEQWEQVFGGPRRRTDLSRCFYE